MQKQLSITIDTVFDKCLTVFLFVSTLIWLPGIRQNSLQMICFDYGSLLLFGLSIALPAKRDFKNYNIFLVFFLCIFVSIANNYKAYPINLIHVISGCLLYFSVVRSVKNIELIKKVFIYIALINIPFFILQRLGVNVVYNSAEVGLPIFYTSGLMSRNYHLAYFLSFAFMFAFSSKQMKILYAVALIAILLLIKSYACILAFAIGGMVFAITKYKKKAVLPIIIVAVLFSGLIAYKHNTVAIKFLGRSEASAYIVREILVNPFIGHGIGSFEFDVNLFGKNPKHGSAYNQYARLAYEMGLLPFLLLCFGIIRYYKSICRKNPMLLGALAVILVFPLFHEVLRWARLSISIVVIVALYEVYCLDKIRKEQLC